jgi:TP901 family phage tail tape measure protein
MTQFKLSGKDVPHIADLLAAGADKALGSVQDLGQGLKFVGPVAESMGISLEQTVGTLSLFAQNGILAEQAGTGLRGVLLSLTSPSKIASDEMKKYGINLYDAKGKFIGIERCRAAAEGGLGGLDQATRTRHSARSSVTSRSPRPPSS